MIKKELLYAEVHCDGSDLKKFQNCDAWIVNNAEWNIRDQRGVVSLRQFTSNDM